MEIASCGLYLQPITNGALEEKFVREFFCPYFIVSLHAITEHGEVVLKGVFAANLLPDGINRVGLAWEPLNQRNHWIIGYFNKLRSSPH